VREAGWYWVDVMQGDTLVRDSIHCNVKPACFLISPVFYPNREISNGCYDLQIACEMESFWIKIFNRWGSLMYESRDPKACWDAKFKGEDLPEGMYTCIVEWIAVGEPLRKKSSFITILR
jgi:gliding motility-associated-like protein